MCLKQLIPACNQKQDKVWIRDGQLFLPSYSSHLTALKYPKLVFEKCIQLKISFAVTCVKIF